MRRGNASGRPSLLAFRLWRAFYYVFPPPPVLWHNVKRPQPASIRHPDQGFLGKVRPVALTILRPLIWLAAVPFVILSVILIIVAGGTIAGLYTAFRLSVIIATATAQGKADLLAVTPSGLFGAHCGLAVHFLRSEYEINLFELLSRGIYVCVLYVWLVSVPQSDWPLISFVQAVVTVILICVDLRLSIITAVLIAMIVPTGVQRRLDAGVAAAGLFLTVQFAIYAVIGIAALWLPGMLLPDGIFLLALRCVAVLAVRETGIRWLWRFVEDRLNTDSTELHWLLQSGRT